jgi:glycerol-3-phosphate O-acyltransferase
VSSTITVTRWLAALVGLLALWGALDLVVLPLVRALLRRRVRRVLDEVEPRLTLRLRPFKLARRQGLVDRLAYDARVVEAAEEEARRRSLPLAAVMREVRRYADEIVPAFNAYVYFRFGYALARRVARALYRVRLGSSDEAALARVDPRAAVVFVINHRSNMDYLLVAHMVAERAALSYAVGEWARIFPLETLIRAMGAYFVRRGSGNELYRRVLERYVAIATAEGVTQAVFPEGGLSRDGKLRPPKLGIFDYMVRAFDPRGERDVVFVPVAVNYDRVLEDRTLLLDATPGAAQPARRNPLGGTLAFLGRNLALLLRQEWRRFGYACVNFGEPLSLREFLARRAVDDPRPLAREARGAHVAALAEEMMARVAAVVPVLPVALVATVFVGEPGRRWSRFEVKSAVLDLWRRLAASGARLYVPRHDQEYAVEVGVRMLTLRHLVREEDGLLAASPADLPVLAYYANSIAHLVARAGSAGA